MDSRGWIPIPLIASFNRVRTLTTDVRLVKDVLILSNIVEVKHDWVRMGGNQWEQFVLPDAPTSSVESRDAEYTLALAHEDRRVECEGDVVRGRGKWRMKTMMTLFSSWAETWRTRGRPVDDKHSSTR